MKKYIASFYFKNKIEYTMIEDEFEIIAKQILIFTNVAYCEVRIVREFTAKQNGHYE